MSCLTCNEFKTFIYFYFIFLILRTHYCGSLLRFLVKNADETGNVNESSLPGAHLTILRKFARNGLRKLQGTMQFTPRVDLTCNLSSFQTVLTALTFFHGLKRSVLKMVENIDEYSSALLTQN